MKIYYLLKKKNEFYFISSKVMHGEGKLQYFDFAIVRVRKIYVCVCVILRKLGG